MFCAKCGLKLPDNIKFCPKCGNRILKNGTDGEELRNAAEVMGEQHQPEPEQQATGGKSKKSSGGKKKIILGLLCTVCCIAVLMLIIRNESKIDELFKDKEQERVETAETESDTSVLHHYDDTYNARNMVDRAGVLSASDEKELSEYMEKIKNVQNCELVAVIIPQDELNGNTIDEYIEAYYLQNDIGVETDNSGVLLLATLDDEGHGDARVYTCGKATEEIADEHLENLFWNEMISHMKNREYKAAVNHFADICSGLLGINMESD